MALVLVIQPQAPCAAGWVTVLLILAPKTRWCPWGPAAPRRVALTQGTAVTHVSAKYTLSVCPFPVCVQKITGFRTNCSRTVKFLVTELNKTASSRDCHGYSCDE